MLLWEEETVKQKTHWNINKKKKKRKKNLQTKSEVFFKVYN